MSSPALVILNFHGIGAPERRLEHGEAVFWISFDQFRKVLDMATTSKGPQVQITFDDGNASDQALAAPELQARGLTAKFFPLTGRLDQAGSLSTADVQAMVAQGHQIGLHGHAHLDWRSLDHSGQVREFDLSRDHLAAITGQPVTDAAVPFGAYNRRVLRALAQRKFSAVYTSDRGLTAAGEWLRPRVCLRADMDLAQVKAALAGQQTPTRRLRRALGMIHKRVL